MSEKRKIDWNYIGVAIFLLIFNTLFVVLNVVMIGEYEWYWIAMMDIIFIIIVGVFDRAFIIETKRRIKNKNLLWKKDH